jgi:hypothetical protein
VAARCRPPRHHWWRPSPPQPLESHEAAADLRVSLTTGGFAGHNRYMPKRGERTAERITVVCPCGKEFTVTRTRYEAGRGRRCSKECKNRYMTRPSGLKYNVKQVNRAWRKPGDPPNATSFKQGQTPWNKGLKGRHASPETEFKAAPVLTYGALHQELRRVRGPASRQACQQADGTCKGPMHWANISGQYESVEDFMPLCQSHHFRRDKELGRWGGSIDWKRPR